MESISDDLVERQFSVGPGSDLTIGTVSGRITIRRGPSGSIRVRAAKHGSSRALDNTRIELSQDGNRVSIQTRGGNAGRLNFGRTLSSVDYDVEVPEDCEVRAKGVSADIEVEGTASRVTIQTVSGDVSIDDISGDCSVTTVSGDVVGKGITGVLSLHTTSGDTTLSASQLRSFNLHSVSGDFSIQTPLVTGEHYMARTVSGDVEILVPAGTGATVQMKSISGDVVSELPAEIIKMGRRHWQGRINGGGASVEMNSVSGDMRIAHGSGTGTAVLERAGGAETDRPGPPSDLPRAESRGVTAGSSTTGSSAGAAEDASSVLGLLERGEITVDEAMRRLEALR